MKMKKILVALFAGVIGTAVLGVSAMAAGDSDAENGVAKLGDDYYSTVQLAIADAEEGDTVYVLADPGAFTVNKAVTVKGVDDADGKVGLVDYQYVTIAEGIDGKVVIDNLAFNGTTNHIIVFSGNDFADLDLTIKDCYIEYNGNRGIYVDKELEALTVSGCTIDNKASSYVSSYAIWTNPNASATMNITGNEIKGAGALRGAVHVGDYAPNGSEITISGNKISGVERGVQVANQSENVEIVIEDNTFTSIKLCEGSTKTAEECAVVFIHENATTNLDVTVKANTATDSTAVIYSENAAGVEEFVSDFTNNTLNDEFVDVNGVIFVPVAEVEGIYYATIKEALDVAAELGSESSPVTINLSAGEITESITLPSNISYVTFKGAPAHKTVLKNSTVGHSGGMSAVKTALTFDGIVFDNSNINLTAIYENTKIENMTINNCKFINIEGNAAVSINTNSLPNLVGFTFTNNVIDGVTGGSFSGLVLRAAPTGDIVITGNEISNVAWNAIQLVNLAADANVTITDNTMSSGASGGVLNIYNAKCGITLADNTINTVEGQSAIAGFTPVAKIGDKQYTTLDVAIADANDDDTITIKAGTYNAFEVPADKNNLTFVGEKDAEGNNLVTIRTMEADIETVTKGIHTKAETLTFKNLDFVSGTVGIPLYNGSDRSWMTSAIGITNGSVGNASSGVLLKNLTIENCNFTGSGVYSAIWVNKSNLTVKNCTISGYEYGIDTYTFGDGQKIIIEDSEITNVYAAFRSQSAAEDSEWKVTNSYIDAEGIFVSKKAIVNIENSTIKNASLVAYNNTVMNVTNSALYDTEIAPYHNTAKVNLSAVYANNVNELAEAAKAENITFSTYYPTYEEFEDGTGLKDVPAASDAIYVEFADKTAADAEGEKIYDINLVATDSEIINRLNSADLTFTISNTTGKTSYEIIASNKEVAINPVNNSDNRYEFHYDGKDNVATDSANTITIGQVKFTGYGIFTFAVDTSADTNVAHATTIADNIVDTFVPNDDTTTVADGELVIADAVINTEILVPTRDLIINIDFPNEVYDNEAAYQDMTVTVSGADLETDLVVELGKNGDITDLDEYITKTSADKAVTAVYANGAYKVTVTDLLNVDTTYTVVVEGAGYRTARYNVTMNCEESKTLNFWNNVKDNAIEVEEDKDSSAKNVTFLAGDIVKDSIINVYDLSAVVSYFGEIDLAKAGTQNDYAKYDLNRDGKIDSKDVAYVLVSWGK